MIMTKVDRLSRRHNDKQRKAQLLRIPLPTVFFNDHPWAVPSNLDKVQPTSLRSKHSSSSRYHYWVRASMDHGMFPVSQEEMAQDNERDAEFARDV